jgi:EAL domain-containing protein (putative c-di-GMP-specific phosphodiesterase class I)
LKLISDMWFWIILDDLYSWYSNKSRIDYLLSYWINISTVKVDGKFIKNMYECYINDFSLPDIVKFDWKILKMYSIDDFDDFDDFSIYLKSLQLMWIKLVAEWIENREIFDFAKELWFDYFQWYYIQNMNANLSEI